MSAPIAEVIEELRRLVERSSPAPWKWHWRSDADAPGSIAWNVDSGRSTAIAMCPRYGAEQFEHDAALIVVARNALPALLDHIATLTSDLETVRRELAAVRSEGPLA